MSETRALLEELIRRPSLTPDDAGCCTLLGAELAAMGFTLEWLNHEGVTNLWATRGESGPLIVFAGHTDVVPPGPRALWDSDPFAPTERDGVLYGRGAADMKSGLAAFTLACRDFLREPPEPPVRLAFLLTSDEEGPCRHGTRHVARVLAERGIKPDYVVVGEASAESRVGDRYVVGRRGSLGCDLTVHGIQGHVAYPQRADNPIHRLLPAMAELTAREWDQGNADFPPTSFQISNLNSGTGVNNVIPGAAQLVFNFRYAPCSEAPALRRAVEECLDRHQVRYTADWWHSGEPYHTPPGVLTAALETVVGEICGTPPVAFTGGGTSDGRFLAPLGAEVVELGPVSATIHKPNECIDLAELETLRRLYAALLSELSARTGGP